MARIIVKDNGTDIVWEADAWCTELPEWWTRNCGCKRLCRLSYGLGSTLFTMHPSYVKHLFRYGYVVVQGWVLRLVDKETVKLYPWPKKLYKNLF